MTNKITIGVIGVIGHVKKKQETQEQNKKIFNDFANKKCKKRGKKRWKGKQKIWLMKK